MTERILVAWLVCAAACGHETALPDSPNAPEAPLLTIAADGTTTTYLGGPAVRLIATATYGDQPPIDATVQATWSASNDFVLIHGPGEVRPLGAGQATITARLDGAEATIDVSVLATSVIAIGVVNGAPGGRIITFAPNADGDIAPLRQFRSAWSALDNIGSIQIANGELFVSNRNDIQVFDADADATGTPLGQVSPKRKIWGTESQLNNVGNLSVRGAEIFSLNQGGILVHPIEANDKTPPLRSIANLNRGYSWLQVVGNELFASSSDGHLDVYPATASGLATPIRTLFGPNTGLTSITGFYATASELFVIGPDNQIRVFSSSATGDVAPVRILNTGQTAVGAFLRPPSVFGSELYVLDIGAGAYTVYDVDASGMAAPLRTVVNIAGTSNSLPVAIHAH